MTTHKVGSDVLNVRRQQAQMNLSFFSINTKQTYWILLAVTLAFFVTQGSLLF